MKKMRRLIPAIAMLLVSAVMLSTASFAWFTISTQAAATGMSVTATASSSLVITDTDAQADWLKAIGTVNMSGHNGDALTPATHDSAYTTNGLKTVADPAAVDPATGAYTGAYTAAVEDQHFIDYVVYLGTTSGDMFAAFLNAEVSITGALKYDLHNAVTIDFLVDGTYAGSINLEDVNDNSLKYNIDLAKNVNIPEAVHVNDAGESVVTGQKMTITMRVYFDGALVQSEAVTDDQGNVTAPAEYYVQNTASTDKPVGFSVNFAVKATASSNDNASTIAGTATAPTT